MDSIQIAYPDTRSENIRVPSIYCIGLNYADHAAEMQSTRPAEPVVFLKPASALLSQPAQLAYPQALTQELHHEVEVVVVLAQDAWQLTPAQVSDVILGYGIGLDLTLRDRQAVAKKAGRPWAVSKGFAQSAPVSEFVSSDQIADPQQLDFSLKINGELRQQGNTSEMLFSISELLCYLSGIFQLRRGDLLFTGTPAGVGPLHLHDQIEARLGEAAALRCQLV